MGNESGLVTNHGTSFMGNFLRLITGTGISAIIVLLITPFLTRLFTPEVFGLTALFVSISGILSVLACLRYELSIVIPDNDRDAVNLFCASIGISIVFSVFIAFIIWFMGPGMLTKLNMPGLIPYLWIIPVSIFLNGLYTALNHLNLRTKQFTNLSFAQVVNQLIGNSAMLGAGIAGYTTAGVMIAATVFGKGLATVILGILTFKHNSSFLFRSISWQEMLAGLKRYKKFPLYGSWSILLGVGSWQLPVLMLGIFFSPVIVGFYALGFRILQSPMNILGDALGKVFFQSAVEANKQGSLAVLVEEMFHKLVIVSLFPLLMLTIIGRDLYIIVFGANWAEAGLYTQILSIWAFFWFVSGPFTTLFAVLEKQEIQLKWNIMNFTVRIFSILIGGIYLDAIWTIVLLGISGAVIYFFKVILTLHLANVSILKALLIIGRYTLIFMPAGITVLLLDLFGYSPLIVLLAASFCLTIYTCCMVYLYYPAFKSSFNK